MLKAKKIAIATHFLLTGVAHELVEYLNAKKLDEIVFITLPFHEQRKSSFTIYRNGTRSSVISKKRVARGALDFIIDFIDVIHGVFRTKKRYDIFFGVNNLNCLAGLVLRKLNRVEKVIYYSIDFVPIRFPNKIMNSIYHAIEVYAVNHADEVWNVSPRIAEGREEYLGLKNSPKQQVVPIGVWSDQIQKVENLHPKKNQIVFVGHLLEKQGLQEVINAIPIVIKDIKNLQLVIIGGGGYKKNLEAIVKDKKLGKYVKFLGWISEKKEVNKILRECDIAVATYKPEKKKLYNFTYYADPTKIKDYLSAGLPIILTDVPYNAYYMQKKKCAVVVEYNADKIAVAMKSLLTDDKLLHDYQVNAIRTAHEFDWNNIFSSKEI